MTNKLKKLLPGIRENVLLKDCTTFRIGGPAALFYEVKKETDLIKTIKICRELKIPFFILGLGSNLLFSDKGYRGLIIKMKNEKISSKAGDFSLEAKKLKIKKYNQKFKIICGAGMPLIKLVFLCKKWGAAGLEWAAGIPGTVGGAIRGNAGAFGGETENNVKKVRVLNTETLKIKIFKNKDCQFNYRSSFFKKNPQWVVMTAEFEFMSGEKEEISRKINFYLQSRKNCQPLEFPSAGSVFKNPRVSKEKLGNFLKKFPQMTEKIKDNRIPAGFLIEKAGLKGKTIGKAMVSLKHRNFIVNLGGASAEDVKKLIKLAKEKVKKRFGLKLEEEIVIMPSEVRQNDEPST